MTDIIQQTLKQKPLIVTHNGNFHTDDVFAVALLCLMYPDANVVRSRDQKDFEQADLVVDVGLMYDATKNRYDHHQDGRAGARDNGILFSGFGLVWRHFGLEFCENDEEVCKRLDEQLVMSIDADDNGQELYVKNEFNISPFTINDVTEVMNPAAYEDNNFDDRFFETVEIAKIILQRTKKRVSDTVRAEKEFVALYNDSPDKRYVVLPRHLPRGRVIEEIPELLFVVFPADANPQWIIRTVPKKRGSFENRKSLPSSWGGKNGADLEAVCGVKGAVFCHNAGFIAAAETKEGALEMLKLALDS